MARNPFSVIADKSYYIDTSFDNLMKRRIARVLIICSKYDAFILEEDGRIEEQIFNEYVSLNLRYPPKFIQTSTYDEAYNHLMYENIDLIITMLSVGKKDVFEFAKEIKEKYPDKPIIVLTPFSREVSMRLAHADFSAVDYVFSWLGNADILLAIIKLIEDKLNIQYDVDVGGVQTILLVEDSIRFYSSYLPHLYKIIISQSRKFMTEGLNEHQKVVRMRGRPKVILATTYEEAVKIYGKYKNNLLGIISDINIVHQGVRDPNAGFAFVEMVRKDMDKDNEYDEIPILLQSSNAGNESKARKDYNVGFINKHSKTLLTEMREFIIKYFAFGDFVFMNPLDMSEIGRASDLRSLQEKIFDIPDDTILYHISHNHFSKWFKARALFPLANMMKTFAPEDFADMDEVRRFMFDAISAFRKDKGRGIIAKFYREKFDDYLMFARIGEGSIGGKARGLAFIDSMIKRNSRLEAYEEVYVTIPRTLVLTTDVFDEFMEDNDLYRIGLSDRSDADILQHFISGRLPFRIHEDLYAFISQTMKPIAVRSSSLLEDSHYQPFAGIYNTYMIPNSSQDERILIEELSDAIKAVYASVYYKDSKAYMNATSNVIDQEKMAVVLQEVCGTNNDGLFYPTISGVARSINFYPVPPERSEDGIAEIALGLGKYIVDGGTSIRFSPKTPKKVLQLSSSEMALKETQKIFYTLDINSEFKPSVDDSANLLKLPISKAENNPGFKHLASTYDFQNDQIREGLIMEGKRIITFSNILNYNFFPLADILNDILSISQKEMNNPVEIEFAVNLNTPAGRPKTFYLLQIRPIVDNDQTLDSNIEETPTQETIIFSELALGNGIINNIRDVIYVKPETFNPARTLEIAEHIAALNESFMKTCSNYILIGPGRWGSSDPWLGIPVKWPQISCARVIVESNLENYRIDPSQGTHFFHNLTSFRVGYFTLNTYINDGFYDLPYLNSQKAVYEDEYIRHVKFENPLLVKIDGKKNKGLISKPI